MITKINLFLLSSSIVLFFFSCSNTKTVTKETSAYPQTAEEIKALTTKIDKAYYSMLGEFSNKKQADTTSSPYCKDQIMRGIPIWTTKGRPHWLCLGWFMESDPTKPIATGVFHLSKHSKDTFKLDYYTFPSNINLETVWDAPAEFDAYAPTSFSLQEGCSSFLVYKGDNKFEVSNDDNPCFNDISSHMKYFDMNATFTPEMQIHANSFFDVTKKLTMTYPPVLYERVKGKKKK